MEGNVENKRRSFMGIPTSLRPSKGKLQRLWPGSRNSTAGGEFEDFKKWFDSELGVGHDAMDASDEPMHPLRPVSSSDSANRIRIYGREEYEAEERNGGAGTNSPTSSSPSTIGEPLSRSFTTPPPSTTLTATQLSPIIEHAGTHGEWADEVEPELPPLPRRTKTPVHPKQLERAALLRRPSSSDDVTVLSSSVSLMSMEREYEDLVEYDDGDIPDVPTIDAKYLRSPAPSASTTDPKSLASPSPSPYRTPDVSMIDPKYLRSRDPSYRKPVNGAGAGDSPSQRRSRARPHSQYQSQPAPQHQPQPQPQHQPQQQQPQQQQQQPQQPPLLARPPSYSQPLLQPQPHSRARLRSGWRTPSPVSDDSTIVGSWEDNAAVRVVVNEKASPFSPPATPPQRLDVAYRRESVAGFHDSLVLLARELSSAFAFGFPAGDNGTTELQVWVMIEAYKRLRQRMAAAGVENAATAAIDCWLESLCSVYKDMTDGAPAGEFTLRDWR
ncbi:hypothetical protein RJ55_08532 [Drechmeria coniospora]|nr:hypothetical protein RJ55_08532 [Drechmeria coniospora]